MSDNLPSSGAAPSPDSVLFHSTTEGLWGGSERLWSQAALVLAGRGVRVGAFFPYYKDIAPIRTLAAAGVEIFFGSERPTRWWRRIGRPRRDRPALFQNCLQEFRPALVVCNQGAVRDGLPELAMCRARGLPYAMLNQAVEPLHYGDSVWRQLGEMYGGARHLWCVSRENLEELRRYLAAPLPHAEFVPNSYGCAFDVDCPWPADSTVWRLAVVARLEPEQKAQDLVLEVLSHDRWRSRPLHVDFFGAGPAQARLTARCRELSLTNAAFPGEANIGQIWRDHHALLLPSRYEGQSLAMIEAMLHSRPVIATPVGGTAGVILEGKTGYLAAAISDAAALEAVMERAWTDRARWMQVGSEAAAHIRRVIWRNPGQEFAGRVSALIPDRTGHKPS